MKKQILHVSKGDIAVRLSNKLKRDAIVGAIYEAAENRDDGKFPYTRGAQMYPGDWRPATESERYAYSQGITHIDGVKQYLKKHVPELYSLY